jgi:hypothetical protein
LRNEFLCLQQGFEHHRKDTKTIALLSSDRPHRSGPAMPFPRPSIFRHGLSRRNDPFKSTRFYYPAKILELLSTTAMIMIRNLDFHLARHAARVATPVRIQAPQ